MQTRLKLLLTSTILTPMLLLMSGCARHQNHPPFQPIEDVIPDSKVVDFRMAPCETLWTLDDNATLSNSLYWLRAMDCSDRMSSAQANYQAALISASGWANIFKQSILAAGSEPDLTQRQALLNNVNASRAQMPGEIRPLVQVWRERQSLQVALEDEKMRNARQQAANEAQLAEMSNQQKTLQASLEDTRRKLQNLTDIERQLSSRKQLQSELPDGELSTKDNRLPPKTSQSK